MCSKTLTPVLLLALLAGCSAREHLRADFGASNTVNIAAHTLDPASAQRERAPLMGDGQKMEQALKDYRKGKPEASRDQLIISTGK